MSSIRLSGTSSGYYDLTVPAAAGTNSIDLSKLTKQDSNGNITVSHSAAGGAVQAIILNSNGVATVGNEARLHLGATGTGGHGSVLISEFTGVANTNHRTDLIIQTTPGSSVLREHMRIDGDGRVTMPYQVAFSAYQTASYGTSANATLTWSATHVNRGNCFNTSNGTFTAPVAGAYCFQFYQLTANDTTSGDVRININGSVVDGHYGYGGNFQGHKQGTLSCVLQLSANDAVKITSLGANNWNDRHGGFSGFLIG